MVNEWKENYVELLFPWAHQKWSINVEPVQCETHNKKNETHRSMWNEEHFDQISIQHVQKIYNTRGLKIENQTGCAFHSIAATHTTWNRSHVCVCNRTFNSHHHFHKKIVFSFLLRFKFILLQISIEISFDYHEIRMCLRKSNEFKNYQMKNFRKILNQKLTEQVGLYVWPFVKSRFVWK